MSPQLLMIVGAALCLLGALTPVGLVFALLFAGDREQTRALAGSPATAHSASAFVARPPRRRRAKLKGRHRLLVEAVAVGVVSFTFGLAVLMIYKGLYGHPADASLRDGAAFSPPTRFASPLDLFRPEAREPELFPRGLPLIRGDSPDGRGG